MAVITKKMLMMTAFVTLMAAFVTAKLLMMATNVNDGRNPLLMTAVIITKMFFSDDFNMLTDCWPVKAVLPSYRWSVILTFYRLIEGR
jgi:hypothetical protein